MLPPFDTVIVASGMVPQVELLEELKDFRGQIFTIGDDREPSNIYQAFKEGFEIAKTI
ncbi:MAG: hypothetical protein ABIJ37_02945 [Pseudomonadota bacterium]